MAHHSEHAPSDLELDAISEGLGLGATGQFPDGSIDEKESPSPHCPPPSVGSENEKSKTTTKPRLLL